jgi:hypothetical protein
VECTYRHLFGGPDIQVDGLDLTDVRSHTAMYSRASNTDEHPTKINVVSVSVGLTHKTRKTNIFHDAHRGSMWRSMSKRYRGVRLFSIGSPFFLQSAHTLFSGRFTSSRSVRVCLSVVCLSCRDIIYRCLGLVQENTAMVRENTVGLPGIEVLQLPGRGYVEAMTSKAPNVTCYLCSHPKHSGAWLATRSLEKADSLPPTESYFSSKLTL